MFALQAVSVGADFNVSVGCSTGELYLLDMSEAADAVVAAASSSPVASIRLPPKPMSGERAAHDEVNVLWRSAEAMATGEMERISRAKFDAEQVAIRELERSSVRVSLFTSTGSSSNLHLLLPYIRYLPILVSWHSLICQVMGLDALRRRLEVQHAEEVERIRTEAEAEITKVRQEAREQIRHEVAATVAMLKMEVRNEEARADVDRLIGDTVRQTNELRESAERKLQEVRCLMVKMLLFIHLKCFKMLNEISGCIHKEPRFCRAVVDRE